MPAQLGLARSPRRLLYRFTYRNAALNMTRHRILAAGGATIPPAASHASFRMYPPPPPTLGGIKAIPRPGMGRWDIPAGVGTAPGPRHCPGGNGGFRRCIPAGAATTAYGATTAHWAAAVQQWTPRRLPGGRTPTAGPVIIPVGIEAVVVSHPPTDGL